MIEVNQLSKRYNRFTAVDNISFSVGKGQVVGFLGPNGAGKTTTLRMLTGYLPATKGTATIGGHDIFKDSIKARRKIGYMPENVPLYDDMRVREYLKFRAQLKGLKELLILDEPTNGLDPNQIRSIRKLIKKLGESHTVLLSTHILSEVEMIADHVIIVDGGKIKANDTPSNLSNNMRAAGKISLEIKGGEEETILGSLQRLDHVKKVLSHEQEEAKEWHQFDVLCDSGTDTREKIATMASQNGWKIRSLHRHSATLEDVFVELTRKD